MWIQVVSYVDVHQWHSNTLSETEQDKLFNNKLEPAFKDNPEVGTVGIYNKYTRLTFVCYLREKVANCPDEIDELLLTSQLIKIKDKDNEKWMRKLMRKLK